MIRNWRKTFVWALAGLALAAGPGCSSRSYDRFDATTHETNRGDSRYTQDVLPDVLSLDQVQPADVEADVRLPEPTSSWESGAKPLEWPAWADQRPWSKEVSSWAHGLEEMPAVATEMRYFSDLALGNGTVFTMAGYQGPMDRLHGMVGPGYQRGSSFFSDTWLEVIKDNGKKAAWRNEWIGRLSGSPVVWTQALEGTAGLATLSAAVLTTNPDSPLARAIIRVVVVRNRSDAALTQSKLVVRFGRDQTEQLGGAVEVQEEQRRTVLVLDGGTATVGAKEMNVNLPEIPASGEHVLRMAIVLDRSDQQRDATIQALQGADFDVLFQDTVSAWKARLAKATTIETPDPMVNQYLEQALLVLFTQTANEGSICPMSQYTRFWVRDAAGPIRYLLRVGLFEEARKTLDYLWSAALKTGGAKNSYDADIDPNPPYPEQPDWEAMGPLSGHARAETPSHVPLMHYWYWMASGNDTFLPERLAMMKYTLEKQAFEGSLLPFSGDETFRAAMAAAHAQPLTQEFVEGFYSSFSSLIWVVGAEALAAMMEAKGETQQADVLRQRAAEVRAEAEKVFRRDDGAWVPYVQSSDLKHSEFLFEDVSLKPLWFAYDSPDTQAAHQNLQVAIDEIGGDDGILVTPLPEMYHNFMGLPIQTGIYTGMNPGYFLWDLAAVQHPLAEMAFNAMRKHATPTGTHPEYQILDDFAPLHLMYTETGAEPSDYTARYRPWEGGINADAVMFYLLGVQQDAHTGTLRLAPHLPNGWSWMKAKGIRVGDTWLDVVITKPSENHWHLQVTRTAGSGVKLRVTLPPGPTTAPTVLVVNGTEVPCTLADTGWLTQVCEREVVVE